MLTKSLTTLCLLSGTSLLHAQATPAASRAADLQIGFGYTSANSGYVQNSLQGFAAYADLDLTLHLGLEAEIHQTNDAAAASFSEKSYEIGVRYFRAYGPLVPYIKGMAGRGAIDYPNSGASLGYGLFAGGAGLDYKLARRIHLRADYELQKWSTFQNGMLNPRLLTIGVAYHFDGGRRH